MSHSVLIVCHDLFFGSQLTGAVGRAGVESTTAMTLAKALELAPTKEFRAIVVDLELPGLDLALLKSVAPAGAVVIAFGPHVHESLLQAARMTGCDHVMSRGEISRSLEGFLRSL